MASITTTSNGQRLSAAEAEQLWRAWKERGDAQARDRLVLAYAPMVRFLAHRKLRELPDHCDADDLASAGLLALIEATDRFDPAKGASFEQYAWTRVAGALVDELRRVDWASRSVRRTARRIEKARDTFQARHGAAPTRPQLAKELGLSLAELEAAVADIERADLTSLNAPLASHDDAGPAEVGDGILGPASYEPETSAVGAEHRATLRAAIAKLSEREQRVLALVHVNELPGAEIGRLIGVSESRVSQILSDVRRKLRAHLEAADAAPLAA